LAVVTLWFYLRKYKLEIVITSYCKIRNNKVCCNGKTIFTSEAENSSAFLKEIYTSLQINYPKFHKMDNLSKLGLLASEYCFKNTEFLYRNNLSETAIVLSNHASSLDTDRVHQNSIQNKEKYLPSPAIFVYTLPNIVIGEIAIKYKITGENIFLVSDKFDAATQVGYIQQLLKTGAAGSALCGWVNVDEGDYEAFIYLVEIQTDSIKNVNFKPLNQTIVNQLYQE
jgi:3-oxoacyl-(acyl-carrier-protein) synthase